MGVLASHFLRLCSHAALFAGIINWLDRYEKEPKILLGRVFTWGAVVAGGGAFIINTVFGISIYMFTGSEAAAEIDLRVDHCPDD